MNTPIKPKGFTLIEMLCVLLIISVLALVAYPSYTTYIYKSNRLDAQNSLFHFQALWQKCMLNTPNAEECLNKIGLGVNQIQMSLSSHYEVSADINDSKITFSARPISSQAKDTACAQFLLDNLGQMKAYDNQQHEATVLCW